MILELDEQESEVLFKALFDRMNYKNGAQRTDVYNRSALETIMNRLQKGRYEERATVQSV